MSDRTRNPLYSQRLAPYLFVAPFVILFAVFGLYPLVRSVYLALHQTAGPGAQVFVGLDNFRFMFSDPLFWKAVRNTVIFAVFSVLVQVPLALGLALLVNSRWLKGRNFWRLCFFSPRLVGMVFVALIFGLIFDYDSGMLNKALVALEGPAEVVAGPFAWLWHQIAGIFTDNGSFGGVNLDWKIQWLETPSFVLPAIVITATWLYIGFNMIYFLAALQSVDEQLYEAADVDGASRLQKFWNVTLPSIKPVAVFVVVLSTIGSFQLFELPFVMFRDGGGRGPDNSALTVVTYLYQSGFVSGDLGYASSIAWTLVAGVLVLALVQIRVSGTWKKDA
ncbi:MAG: carbohydrate ABC transporter permease [Phycisphaerae bacterium]